MSGGRFENFYGRLEHFGDQVRDALDRRGVDDPEIRAAILHVLEKTDALAPQLKAIEFWFDGDIVKEDLLHELHPDGACGSADGVHIAPVIG